MKDILGESMKNRVKDESDGSLWFDALLLLAVIGVLIFSFNSIEAAPNTIDFDTHANGNPPVTGQIIGDDDAAIGIHSASDNEHVGSNLDIGMDFNSGNPVDGDTN